MSTHAVVRKGNLVSTSQIAHAVKNERMVTAIISADHRISGYVCGADDYHWAIVQPGSQAVLLIHKSVPAMEIHPSRTIETESPAVRSLIRQITGPFRQSTLREHFSHSAKEHHHDDPVNPAGSPPH